MYTKKSYRQNSYIKSLLLFFICITFSFAELKVGDSFPVLKLTDQFDKEIAIPSKGNIKLILSFNKNTSLAMQKYLKSKEDDFLIKNNILYISDVSAAPSFIFRNFALGTLKKLPYRVALLYGNEGEKVNQKNDHITYMLLYNKKIKSIAYIHINSISSLF